jgi:hypothetical protein
MQNFVPVKANLMERHIENRGTCPDCGAQDETVYHALITCTFATMFWQSFYEMFNIKLLDCILLHGVLIYWIIHFALLQIVAPFYVECG